MIDQVDLRLREWIGTVLEGVDVTFAKPGDGEDGRQGVGLYLMEIICAPPPRTTRRPPLQVSLRYLVTAWAERPEEGHRLLGELMFAAMDNAEIEVEPEPLPNATWTALGVSPRPSFVIRCPLRQERAEPAAPLVRMPLVIRNCPTASLAGVVLGPGDVPIMGAQVELPALQVATRTDPDGRFRFQTVPTEPRAKVLRVRAKGREVTVTTEHAAGDGQPLLIRLQGMEG